MTLKQLNLVLYSKVAPAVRSIMKCTQGSLFHRMNLILNRFHLWSIIWQYFSRTPWKVCIMAIIGQVIIPIMANGQYKRYGSTYYGCKFDLCGCPSKVWPKCRSSLKTVLKTIHHMETGQKNGQFLTISFVKLVESLIWWHWHNFNPVDLKLIVEVNDDNLHTYPA